MKTAFASLLWTTTIGLAIALPLAEPLSRLLLDHSDPGLMRIAIFGLWVFTMFEFLTALFRLDERAKAYFAFTVSNVLVTIPVTVWLVVGEDKGASGLLWGQYATGALFLAGLIVAQRRRLALIPDFPLWRRMLRWGLPTMPAELSLYSLNFIDRVLIVRLVGLGDAGPLQPLRQVRPGRQRASSRASSSPGHRSRTRSGRRRGSARPTP